MRENSGNGDSHTGHMDPAIKDREADKGSSSQPPLPKKETEAHGGDVQPPNRDDAGEPRAPEMGEPDKH